MARHAGFLPVIRLVSICTLAASLIGGHIVRAEEAPPVPASASNVGTRGDGILISACILEVDESKLEKSSVLRTIAAADTPANPAITTSLLRQAEVPALFQKLTDHGAKIIAEPRLMTMDGQQVVFQSGGELAIGADPEDAAKRPPQFFGTKLKVTPLRLGYNRLLLTVKVDQNTLQKDEGKPARIFARTFSDAFILKERGAVLLISRARADDSRDTTRPPSLVAIFHVEDILPAHTTAVANPTELDSLREEVRELQTQVARLSQQMATHATASAKPPRRISVDRAIATEPVDTAVEPKEHLTVKVYAVADLVVPAGDILAVRGASPERQPPAKAEFKPLVELISKTIEPDSWKKEGRTMAAMDVNLSLVVTQTPAVHEQIAVLLQELRSKQDQIVQLEIEVVSATLEAAHEAGLDLASEGRLLLPETAARVREAFREGRDAKVVSAPRVTMLNKQLCELETTISRNRSFKLLAFGALESDDFQTVRLNLAVNAKDAADVVRSSFSGRIESGVTLALDVTDRVAPEGNDRGVPVLKKIPHFEKLFKNIGPDKSQRTLLLITPTVKSVPEEE